MTGRRVFRGPDIDTTQRLDRLSMDRTTETDRIRLVARTGYHTPAVEDEPARSLGTTGCNVGAKNSLTANYLPAAVAVGAALHTGAEVLYVRAARVPVGAASPLWRSWCSAAG